MNDNTNSLFTGQDVWWSDPENKTSGAYIVLEIKRNPDDPDEGLYDDTIVLISNGVSEAEVEAWELQDLGIRRKRISELIERVTAIAEDDNWGVHNHDENYDKVDLYLSKYSSAGQDFGFYIECETGDVDEFINAVEGYYNSYDPCEEAVIWLGPDGHGKNGAPYDLKDLIEDMEDCKNNVKGLLDYLRQELKRVKITKPSRHSQYSERVYNIRTEIIESVLETIKDICRQTKGRSILWDSLTNHLNTDICYEKDSGPSSVLPDTIGLTDDDKGFYITFASYCDAPSSNDGENIYTETLIDILEYLENYRSTL
ncbi:MAG: hypothetical protein JFT10_07355 [Muribaculaceae bacterium]|uniref:hypothetical protein n=1 Tax=Duncaniella muris TaxID=2094150 RepID=UPI000F49F4D0|nr:hypothetical protein [Duncaniella muris]MBJ2190650.1 hypothetical protein [Muribaculaceae bacterium]ROS93088.1 hypothetical protein EEL36_05005 [Muribaculaceae bacterium Isolate-043 (Harlan)]